MTGPCPMCRSADHARPVLRCKFNFYGAERMIILLINITYQYLAFS